MAALASTDAAARPVVVELYTSQGCSSCPPADALLGRLAERKDVLALSLPITYWDMLGWKDTLATKANTDRQKAYAQELGRGGVYTPQIIVDGTRDAVGSRQNAVEKAIVARKADLPDVGASLRIDAGEIHVAIGGASGKPPGDATVWMLTIRPRVAVKIDGGENAGHTLTYRNIVTQIKAIGLWKGRKMTLDLPRDTDSAKPEDGVAVIVQQAGYGTILAATPISWPDTRK